MEQTMSANCESEYLKIHIIDYLRMLSIDPIPE